MIKRQKKDYKPAPAVNGIIKCNKGHEWNVIDLNPERVTVKCPVCGENTSLRQGLKPNEQR